MSNTKTVSINTVINFTVLAIFALAVVTGLLWAEGAAENYRLLTGLDVYFNAVLTGHRPPDLFEYFLRRILIYGLTMVTVWALAFVPVVSFLAFGILFLRVLALTFTTALFWQISGTEGLIHAAALFGAQNLLWLPVFLIVVSAALRQAAGQIRARLIMGGYKSKAAAMRLKIKTGMDYGSYLLLGMLASVFAALTETWITPVLVRVLL